MDNNQMGPKPDNNLVWGVLCTLFCCNPLGVISMIFASKADCLYAAGDYYGAVQAANDAKKWAIVGIVGGLIIGVGIIFSYALTFASILANMH